MKVGDELAFRTGYRNHYQIHKITKISKTGVITCGGWKFNEDLTPHDDPGVWGPLKAERVTDTIRKQVSIVELKRLLGTVVWDTVDDSKIHLICEILRGK